MNLRTSIQDPTLYHARQIAETIVELYDQNLLDELFVVVYPQSSSAMRAEAASVVRLLPVREEDFDDVPGLVQRNRSRSDSRTSRR